MTLKQTEIARLENNQYRAAKMLTGAFNYTNVELVCETVENVLIYSY